MLPAGTPWLAADVDVDVDVDVTVDVGATIDPSVLLNGAGTGLSLPVRCCNNVTGIRVVHVLLVMDSKSNMTATVAAAAYTWGGLAAANPNCQPRRVAVLDVGSMCDCCFAGYLLECVATPCCLCWLFDCIRNRRLAALRLGLAKVTASCDV